METHALIALISAFLSVSFSLAPTLLTLAARTLRPWSLYADEMREKTIPPNQSCAARLLILAIVGAVKGRTLAVWACHPVRVS